MLKAELNLKLITGLEENCPAIVEVNQQEH